MKTTKENARDFNDWLYNQIVDKDSKARVFYTKSKEAGLPGEAKKRYENAALRLAGRAGIIRGIRSKFMQLFVSEFV